MDSQKILSPQKILGPKKDFGPKKIWLQKNFEPKKQSGSVQTSNPCMSSSTMHQAKFTIEGQSEQACGKPFQQALWEDTPQQALWETFHNKLSRNYVERC